MTYLKDYLALYQSILKHDLSTLSKYDDVIADVADRGDITYVRLCMSDLIDAIGAALDEGAADGIELVKVEK